jgi:hypothetical protein
MRRVPPCTPRARSLPTLALALALALVPLAPTATVWAQQLPAPTTTASAASIDDLCLVEYAPDVDPLAVRDGLIARGGFFGDLGAAGVVRLSDRHVSALESAGHAVHRLAPVREDQFLVFASRTRLGFGPMHGRLLFARRSFFLSVADAAQLPEGCRGSGFHGGLQVLALDRPYAPARTTVPNTASSVPAGAALGTAVDPDIQQMVASVQQQNLQTHVNALAGIFSRRATLPGHQQAVSYVQNQLASVPELTVALDTFSLSYGPNVIAELPGNDLANEIVMVGAHLDSIVFSGTNDRSPGADDNASGSAAVLELARILSQYEFRRTIRFAWWSAEEFGLIGSAAYAQAAAARGDQIVAYVNTDMNAYRAPGDSLSMTFITNDATPSLTSALIQSAQTYVPTLPVTQGQISGGTSDHRAFFQAGFPAAFPFEDAIDYSPFIHSSQDDVGISANDFVQSALITQVLAAGLADLAEPTGTIPGAFTAYGQGCLGSAVSPIFCAERNAAGGTLTGALRNYEYGYRVENDGPLDLVSFDLWTVSGTGSAEAVAAHVYADVGGEPASSPLASTTMTVTTQEGFHTATFATPVAIDGTFYVAVDHSPNRVAVSTLVGGDAGQAFWRTPNTGNWTPSTLVQRPAWRVTCTTSGQPLAPQIGAAGPPRIGRSFDVTLAGARANSFASLFTGLSDQVWIQAGVPLPVSIPTALGCDLQVSLDFRADEVTGPDGTASSTIDVPNFPQLVGYDLYHQWLVFDPGVNAIGLVVSGPGRATLGD